MGLHLCNAIGPYTYPQIERGSQRTVLCFTRYLRLQRRDTTVSASSVFSALVITTGLERTIGCCSLLTVWADADDVLVGRQVLGNLGCQLHGGA